MVKKELVVGIDEVGRGCLAGPVVVCAALTMRGKRFSNKNLGILKDSKKIPVRLREEWFLHLKKIEVIFAISRVSPAVIDRVNISRAANIAAERALKKLLLLAGLQEGDIDVFLDGGLYLGSKEKSLSRAATVIKGDEKIKVIAAASIAAKVTRDRFMVRLSKKYPGYGLEVHKGYGTKAHIRAIKRQGLSDAHRRSFTKKII
ncbi:MAG: Ribonuclease HII [Parcubacteria group bacterium LiPW_15]|nr:MAG: Ribonuclease HII [Parcubacteria group bacterium LiPW_15]